MSNLRPSVLVVDDDAQELELMKQYLSPIADVYTALGGQRAREFDSCVIQKVLAGRIKPAFFMSNFPFFYVLVCNSVVY